MSLRVLLWRVRERSPLLSRYVVFTDPTMFSRVSSDGIVWRLSEVSYASPAGGSVASIAAVVLPASPH